MTGGPGVPDNAAARLSNLQLRVISAVVLLAVVLSLTYLGGLWFRVLAAAIVALVFYEWAAIVRCADRSHVVLVSTLIAVVLAVMVVGAGATMCFAVLAAALVLSAIHAAFRGCGYWMTGGLAYAGLPGIAVAFVRASDTAGLIAVLMLFVVVWATDILAYFVGRGLGGPKLAPRISPAKTWSGAVGGAFGGVVAALAVAAFADARASILTIVVVAAALSVVSQAGDILESRIKRIHGVKDSGKFIPGHGGMMDRVDALIAAAVLFYVVGSLISGPDTPAHAFFRP